MAGHSRTIRNEKGQFSRSHERTFTKSGTYTVKANDARVKTTTPLEAALRPAKSHLERPSVLRSRHW